VSLKMTCLQNFSNCLYILRKRIVSDFVQIGFFLLQKQVILLFFKNTFFLNLMQNGVTGNLDNEGS